jgi:hypothetical protein
MKFYEAGMCILFDPERREVTVTFRGRRITLDGQYDTDHQAREAGEAHCRSLGWKDLGRTPTVPSKSLLSHRKNVRPFL